MNIMDMMDRTQKGFERRLRTFQIVALALLVVLAARLWQLQVMRGDYFKSRSTANRIALVPDLARAASWSTGERRGAGNEQDGVYRFAMPQEFRDRERG